MADSYTIPDLRWACNSCGRFLRQTAIRYEDFRDNGYYYGIRTEVEYDCTRCGLVKGLEPHLIEVGTLHLKES